MCERWSKHGVSAATHPCRCTALQPESGSFGLAGVMRPELLGLMACPRCDGELRAAVGMSADAVSHRSLRCLECGETIAVEDGIPRAAREDPDQEQVAKAFSSQWAAYSQGAFERGTVYGRSEPALWEFFLAGTGLDESTLEHLTVLDAGCGPASVSRQVASHGAHAVVALDISNTIDAVAAETRELENLHVIQADLMSAPLRPVFDLVWSAGVIHHTGDTAAAFHALTRYVRPGGLLYVYVYPRNLRPFHWANAPQWIQAGLVRLGLRRLSDAALFRLAGILSYPTFALHRVYRAARGLPGLAPRSSNARDSVMPLQRRTLHLIWYDALVPPFTSWHTEREVTGWFRAAGFTDVVTAPTRPLGVRGRAPARATRRQSASSARHVPA